MPLIVPTVRNLERLRARWQTRATNAVTSGDLIHEVVEVGQGEGVFRRAAAALRRWDTHRSWWLRVYPADEPPTPGQTVVIQVQAGRFSPLALAFCDRVTDVIDEPRRQGFTYATLPGHPERGAEAFLIEWHADDRVTFTVRAVSQPGWPLLRLVRPALAWLQGRATRQYLRAIARAAVAQNA
ncbi:DUF1990 domain-containing protein [Deinococcus soli (ex Cha et al. 2016)]|uniref:Uncharacterized protein (UPF0548 family) n=2 Tax=Deinococcus soli (ex Cha et al. 2016) TaxID=1309411 RepID=A0ACC6KAP9_9DEIO|nr:DUF1990 domain-containing protein [Deinococcus soli (ex Cha et al. 2016)]MDR6216463.1 uncharacterized protein (UPF0548 family) [Deinococcus soli (ex Cha et al. 2016)]MDR6327284.1 uncharacterized protein (UPF0548 family) [Deinococcus soli (ex Cha et al. 2016)]MDR6749559.1 uncharacterized protein (UPF0548 family) [Deinococcus soli (ex Cha et al. 2016)]